MISFIYKALKFRNDINAVVKDKVVQRVKRRVLGKLFGRIIGRIR